MVKQVLVLYLEDLQDIPSFFFLKGQISVWTSTIELHSLISTGKINDDKFDLNLSFWAFHPASSSKYLNTRRQTHNPATLKHENISEERAGDGF